MVNDTESINITLPWAGRAERIGGSLGALASAAFVIGKRGAARYEAPDTQEHLNYWASAERGALYLTAFGGLALDGALSYIEDSKLFRMIPKSPKILVSMLAIPAAHAGLDNLIDEPSDLSFPLQMLDHTFNYGKAAVGVLQSRLNINSVDFGLAVTEMCAGFRLAYNMIRKKKKGNSSS